MSINCNATLLFLITTTAVINLTILILEWEDTSRRGEIYLETPPIPPYLEISEKNTFIIDSHPVLKDTFLENALFLQRKEVANNMCELYQNNIDLNEFFQIKKDLSHILVDEKRQILYCYVPKVACTNWKRVFMIITGMTTEKNASAIPADDVHRRVKFTTLGDYSINQIKNIVEEYTKMIFVRHPLERLVSAFRNKLQKNSTHSKYFQERFGKYIIKQYRRNPKNDSLNYGHDVSFSEFASFLVDGKRGEFNEHWRPIEQLCYPCAIRYDFIGKYETLYSDSEYLLKTFKSPVKFPKISFAKNFTNSMATVRKYYAKIPNTIIARIYDMFFLDFKLFNYGTEDILGYEIG